MNYPAIVVLAAAAVLTANSADAYVDPGTGGMLTQLVTGGVAGLLVLARLYWSRLTGFFGGGASTKPPADDGSVPHAGGHDSV